MHSAKRLSTVFGVHKKQKEEGMEGAGKTFGAVCKIFLPHRKN